MNIDCTGDWSHTIYAQCVTMIAKVAETEPPIPWGRLYLAVCVLILLLIASFVYEAYPPSWAKSRRLGAGDPRWVSLKGFPRRGSP